MIEGLSIECFLGKAVPIELERDRIGMLGWSIEWGSLAMGLHLGMVVVQCDCIGSGGDRAGFAETPYLTED